MSSGAGPLGLIECADLLGRYRYVELAGFTLLGERAGRGENAEIAAYLAGASAAHGFRARLLEEHLPVSVGLADVRQLTRPPGPAFDQALADFVQAGDDELVAGLVQVLFGAMAEGYRGHLVLCSDYADPPLRRTLRRAIADLEFVIGDGLGLVGEQSPSAPGEQLGAALAALGGVFGPLGSAQPR